MPSYADPYIFKVTFECISPLEDDIEWKLIYVGSAESEKYDQELCGEYLSGTAQATVISIQSK